MTPSIVLADIPPPATISEAFNLMIVGVLIVFMALLLVLGMTVLLRKMTEKEEVSPPVSATPASTPGNSASANPDAVPPAIVAVITAAVVAAVNRPVRITRIRIADESVQPPWATQGRTSIHTSRNIKKG